jgi:hypothetical protein
MRCLGLACGVVAALLAAGAANGRAAPAPDSLVLETAAGHPMRYELSLPRGWSPARRWPVVIALEAAEKDWRGTGRAFVRARGERPFIIAVPHILTNGGHDLRHLPAYHYADSTWNRIDREGNCRFDLEGLGAMIDDIHQRFAGEAQVFLTGWESGGHLLWAETFAHPERLRGVAASSTNYIGRCVVDSLFSISHTRETLPIQVLLPAADSASAAPHGVLYRECQAVRALAEAHGYGNVRQAIVVGKPRGPLADDVMKFFASLLTDD